MGRPTRRQFTPKQKLEIVLQLQRGEKQLTALAREHGVDHTTIYRWRDQVQAAALEALAGQRQAPDAAAEARIRELRSTARTRVRGNHCPPSHSCACSATSVTHSSP